MRKFTSLIKRNKFGVMENISSSANDNYIRIEEGSAIMFYDKKEAVFYNKVQVLNRDLSVQVIRLFASIREKEKQTLYEKKVENFNKLNNSSLNNIKHPQKPNSGIHVLDALAATGLRSIRYVKEIEDVCHITINDISLEATQAANANCKSNNVDMSKITIVTGDATELMYNHRNIRNNASNQENLLEFDGFQYDVIDLDPYGTASPFIDSAVQAISDGGLLCVTCTDMAVLSGNYPEVCYAKYGVMPLKTSYLHEGSLRILLHSIDSSAAKYKKYIVPWLSMSIDFYIRVFVRIFESPNEVKKSCLKNGMVYQSLLCQSYYIQPLGVCVDNRKSKVKKSKEDNDSENNHKSTGFHFNSCLSVIPSVCEETGGKLRLGGPYWIYPIHTQDIVDELLNRLENSSIGSKELPYEPSTSYRLKGLLTAISEELKDVPFYYNLSDIASTLKIASPTLIQMHSALINCGYRVSQFHREPVSIKTDAPNQVVWDIMRAFCKLNPPQGSIHKKFSAVALSILSKEITTPNISFKIPPVLLEDKKKVARYPPNPESFWGPKRRAGKNISLIEEKDTVSDNHQINDNDNSKDFPMDKKSKIDEF